MNAPPPIGPGEELGRSVFSSRYARQAARAGVPHHVFLLRPGETRISVDRLSMAAEGEALAVAIRNASARGRSFYGGATVSVLSAHRQGCEVVAAPVPANPRHAVIVLPSSAATDRAEQVLRAVELAEAAAWKPRPDSGDAGLGR